MILALLLAAQSQVAPAEPKPEPYRPAPATIVAEPVALFIAAADRDRDGRTSLAEFRQAVVETTSADPPWRERGDAGIGYIQYSDWALRWLGDRNAVPTPFEIDRNGDNRVTFQEFSNRMEAIFARFDADKDGAVSRAELLTVRANPLGRPELDRRGNPRKRRR
ncbi:EF-hand domain-containing protein [Sphingomonas sp.]|uniref:EF-hand domain-containing protein n=1 Tax=Sphingomonas sp. TaxID=28214 RepID=UPI002DD620AD|nr:EF-hand domain-containing protein [Sphingomonas sp.]